jgi:hypothetical protein
LTSNKFWKFFPQNFYCFSRWAQKVCIWFQLTAWRQSKKCRKSVVLQHCIVNDALCARATQYQRIYWGDEKNIKHIILLVRRERHVICHLVIFHFCFCLDNFCIFHLCEKKSERRNFFTVMGRAEKLYDAWARGNAGNYF